jgi:hypothetical protein
MLCPSLDTFDNGYQRRDNYVNLLLKHVDHSPIAHYLRRIVVEREQEYQTDQQYEQERFTDEYREYFQDDENKADRFTDDYNEEFKD